MRDLKTKIGILMIAVFLPVMAFAQEGFEEVDISIFLDQLLNSIGGLKGAGAMAIVTAVVQLVMLLSKTKLSRFAGKYRLLLVYGLTMVSGVLTLTTVNGLDIATALIHSNTLASFQVFGNQAIKQFIIKKEDESKPKEA